MNINALDLFFKVLAAGLLPAAIWINSLSVDVALLQDQTSRNMKRLDDLEEEQKKILEGVKETQVALQGIVVTVKFMKEVLTEIKDGYTK